MAKAITKLQLVKPATAAEKETRSTVDTVLLTREVIANWRAPAFQRPLKFNDRFREVVESIKKDGGVLPGILTLGVLDNLTYRVDGQHRIEAWLQTELKEGYADIRTIFPKDYAEMADEYVRLNSAIVKMRPDDLLRGMDSLVPALRIIREKCKHVGYDFIKSRADNSAMVGMATAIRLWTASQTEGMNAHSGLSAVVMAKNISSDEAARCVKFLNLCLEAWGKEREFFRLWGTANLTICAWLYRRLVLERQGKLTVLTPELFRSCLMQLSADKLYLDWLVGRQANMWDRPPTYNRIKAIFIKRIQQETGKTPKLPLPAWAGAGISQRKYS